MDVKALILSGFENLDRSLSRTLDGLTAEEILWHPKPDANSIGLILLHVARSADRTQANLQAKPQLWESGKWYQKLNKTIEDSGAHYTVEQVANFTLPNVKDLMEYYKLVQNELLQVAKTATPERFDQKVNLPPPPPRKDAPGAPKMPPPPPRDFTVGSLLLMDIMHAAQHAGEISYLRGLKRGMDK